MFRTSEELHDRILEFVQGQALVVNQRAGCNWLHEAEARLARWILMLGESSLPSLTAT